MSALHDPTIHGGQLRQIAAQHAISPEQLIDFSANINPAGPPRSVRIAMSHALEKPSTFTTYPDLELVELKRAIAEYVGAEPENVAVANGFVPLLDAALRSMKVKRCLLPVPSFGEYRRTLENAGVVITLYRLSQGNGFEYEVGEILRALSDGACDAILLANPQNPSGALCDAKRMLQLIEMATRQGITVLLDEAFIDYCPHGSVTKKSIQQTNVIVFRSVTKFFAIPGLRVAYAISKSSYIDAINRFIPPWPITSFASDAVCAALQEDPYAEESRTTNVLRRLRLERDLVRLEIATYPSSGNFLLLRFSQETDAKVIWKRMILEEQIVLRSCANFEGLAEGHLRIAVRSEKENEKLILGLERVLSDMNTTA
jgi:threonine-phosphate decarboxylase